MKRYYILEALIILMGLVFVVTAIKYPKDFFVKLPLGIIKTLFAEFGWLISLPLKILLIPFIYLGEKYNWLITPAIQKLLDFVKSRDDKPYPSTRNLKVDFRNGDKYAFVLSSTKDLKKLVCNFLEGLTGTHLIDEFNIADDGNEKIIQFPVDITFYDFHLFVLHLCTELGERNCFGVFNSDKIKYYVYPDSETINNLVGFTPEKKLFSIFMLDNLDQKQHLRLNQRLKFETDWVERVIHAKAIKSDSML